MRSPKTVRETIRALRRAPTDDGAVPVHLMRGPYDGCVLRVPPSVLVQTCKQDATVSVALQPIGDGRGKLHAAEYKILAGTVGSGVRAVFRCYVFASARAYIDCGDGAADDGFDPK